MRPRSSTRAAPRFNSRAHGGRDFLNHVHRSTIPLFQFTRPRGARLWKRFFFSCSSLGVSIHAPTGGATTNSTTERRSIMKVSIHAPTGGATNVFHRVWIHIDVSIHAPTGGATGRGLCCSSAPGFNSRAHGGRDSRGSPLPRWRKSFNSRAHGGRDVEDILRA